MIIASQVRLTLVPQPSLEDVKALQSLATAPEKAMWTEWGAKEGDDFCFWRKKDRLIIAPMPLPILLISEAHGVDDCARGEIMKKIQREGFASPYLQNSVDYMLSQCNICAQNNIRKGITTPIGHIPVPEGPFRHLCIVYVDMIKPVRGMCW